MCIIAIKKAGVALPSDDLLERMFYTNPDGAGMMWVENRIVHISKGYMKYDAFRNALAEIEARLNVMQTPMVFHFRITTHGGTKPENCHPFPVTDNLGLLQKLQCTTNVGVAHNGIITGIVPQTGVSDTMEFIMLYLAKMKQISSGFYKVAGFKDIITNLIHTDRMVFLDKEGTIETVGNFTEDGGILYSNTSYKQVRWASWYDDYTWDDRLVCDIADLNGYVKIKGEEISDYGMFYLDKIGTLYIYDADLDIIIPMMKSDNINAYAADGSPLKYNKEYSILMPCDTSYTTTFSMCDSCRSVCATERLTSTEFGMLCEECMGVLDTGY